jgi:hypothetical protein
MADYKTAGAAVVVGVIGIAIAAGVIAGTNLSGLTATIVGFIPVSLAAKIIYDMYK